MLTENIDRKHKKFEFNFHTIPQKATIVRLFDFVQLIRYGMVLY